MRSLLLWSSALLASLPILSACTVSCDPGSTQACTCAGGAMGAQTCGDEGTSWGACSCVDPLVDSGMQDAGAGLDAGPGVDSGGPGDDAGPGVDAGDGVDAGEPQGPVVMCAMTSGMLTATLAEGSPGANETATLVYFPGGALQSIDGVQCTVDTDRTGERGDCFDPYICGACRILIYYQGASRTMSGDCATYQGFYSIP